MEAVSEPRIFEPLTTPHVDPGALGLPFGVRKFSLPEEIDTGTVVGLVSRELPRPPRGCRWILRTTSTSRAGVVSLRVEFWPVIVDLGSVW